MSDRDQELVDAYLKLFRAQDELREVQHGRTLTDQLRLKLVALGMREAELRAELRGEWDLVRCSYVDVDDEGK